jgi:hypothetical protein
VHFTANALGSIIFFVQDRGHGASPISTPPRELKPVSHTDSFETPGRTESDEEIHCAFDDYIDVVDVEGGHRVILRSRDTCESNASPA